MHYLHAIPIPGATEIEPLAIITKKTYIHYASCHHRITPHIRQFINVRFLKAYS